ncbi:hypothetical protein RIF29_38457 [Crotalaria pallida]|uniref:Uncharacterized protein n=1 Tax=Crotalaria pallida TaxID=3830 RepID=A0AAN9DZZ6_CROPI
MDIAHHYLKGNADVVEFCPYNSYHNVFVASTYTLQEGGQPSRHGSISLIHIKKEIPAYNESRLLTLVEGILAANIFDWGSRACVDLCHKGTIIEIYRMSRNKMQEIAPS